VTPIENPKSQIANPPEALPLSLLNDFLYCRRRAALKIVEGWREENVHTVRGDIMHEHSDLPGYEVVKGVKLLRALPVFSERLGLSGKCDVVEVHPYPQPLSHPMGEGGQGPGEGWRLFPVEFKLGKRRRFENDDAQLCAQALCLEEMFGLPVPRGAIFHADSKRRREVEFTPELRQLTEHAVAELRQLLEQSEVCNPQSAIPVLHAAVFKPACQECSLFDICLPKVAASPDNAARAARRLFEI
jgi:CRISPR-associated exonuclease Cas4